MANVMTDMSRQIIEIRLEIDVALLRFDAKNFYELLGVDRHCERSEIDARGVEWGRKIQRWRSVTGLPGDYVLRVTELRVRVEEAHRTLVDTVRRIHYDQHLKSLEGGGHSSQVLPRTERAQEIASEPPVWSNRSPASSPSNHPPSARPELSDGSAPKRSTASWEAVPSPRSAPPSDRAAAPVEAVRARPQGPSNSGLVIPPPLRRASESVVPQVIPAPLRRPSESAVPQAVAPNDPRLAALEARLDLALAQVAALQHGLGQAALALELLLGPSESPESRRERLIQAAQIAHRLHATLLPR